ncbi:biotin carboxylase, partial [Enterococcus hirae]
GMLLMVEEFLDGEEMIIIVLLFIVLCLLGERGDCYFVLCLVLCFDWQDGVVFYNGDVVVM